MLPFCLLFHKCPLKAGSVPCFLVTANCTRDSTDFQSSSVIDDGSERALATSSGSASFLKGVKFEVWFRIHYSIS